MGVAQPFLANVQTVRQGKLLDKPRDATDDLTDGLPVSHAENGPITLAVEDKVRLQVLVDRHGNKKRSIIPNCSCEW